MFWQSLYRVRQFGNILRGSLNPSEQMLVRQFLNPQQQALFWAMRPLAQRHHLDVGLDLLAGGWVNPDLIRAALLHDVGKGQMGVWPRVAIVLALAAAPRTAHRWAERGGPPPLSWLRTQLLHAEIGAQQVKQTGASIRTVELIRRHESHLPDDPEQTALRRADDRN
ncbi:MAG: HD domain-containing protein [Chloroflexi bacterium]|nr:HD domain-containing protein [Chloroflexota bacterium]